MVSRLVFAMLLLIGAALWGQGGNQPLDEAYRALQAHRYESAVEWFHQAIVREPGNPAAYKDLAYTYLKIGETVAARDQFAAALAIDRTDEHAALEYAFLCNDTKQTQLARHEFSRLRDSANVQVRDTAEIAFQNIDHSLAEGVARWQQAVMLSPDNYSAHFELADLAEQRDELNLALEHYRLAWRLKPDQRQILLRLARVWQALRQPEPAMAALLAASRGAEPHTAEAARALLPSRYPYVYEFQQALAFDPGNTALRRELAFLHLQMNERAKAETLFEQIVKSTPDDLTATAQLGFLLLDRGELDAARPLLERVLAGAEPELADRVRRALKVPQQLRARAEVSHAALGQEARELADKSLAAGYLKDAAKYLKVAQENDPVDFDVMRRLGWTYNNLKQDGEAVKWFALASRSDNPEIATEAAQAYKNLTQSSEPASRITASLWSYPLFSTRWHDTFAYAQGKVEWRSPVKFLRPYLSVRLVGDMKSATAPVQPIYLSETALIAGLGVTTSVWHNVRLWGEAGSAINYLQQRKDIGRMIPDYRGGLSYAKGWHRAAVTAKPGWFAETNDDLLYLSRFNKDTILYSQNRIGATLPTLGPLRSQLFWNVNVTADAERQYWASFVEHGPGVRMRLNSMPNGAYLTFSYLHGYYLVQDGNPGAPEFHDFRVGAWYAASTH